MPRGLGTSSQYANLFEPHQMNVGRHEREVEDLGARGKKAVDRVAMPHFDLSLERLGDRQNGHHDGRRLPLRVRELSRP